MNDTLIHTHLTAFAGAAHKYMRTDEKYRQAWRYKHIQAELLGPRKEALRLAERSAAHLHEAIADLGEPTWLSRTASELLQRWETYQKNGAIYRAERNGHNLQHLKTSETTFSNLLRQTAEQLKKMQQ